jgi:hypothetical protein
MKKFNPLRVILIVLVAIGLVALIIVCVSQIVYRSAKTVDVKTVVSTSTTPKTDNLIVYKNNKYGFDFSLPLTWESYSIINDTWTGNLVSDSSKKITGPKIVIRHPKWNLQDPRQDIPVMIFTLDQWQLIEQEQLAVGAAPIGPTELGRNAKYVFALPARYNFAFPTGYEEVETIMSGQPLKAF